VVLVTEAGGRITNFQGNPFDLYQREIVATNASIGPELVAVLKETLQI
jgi:fructose-1,6-bisphosphatase/inositol monophosphatase family enzyme